MSKASAFQVRQLLPVDSRFVSRLSSHFFDMSLCTFRRNNRESRLVFFCKSVRKRKVEGIVVNHYRWRSVHSVMGLWTDYLSRTRGSSDSYKSAESCTWRWDLMQGRSQSLSRLSTTTELWSMARRPRCRDKSSHTPTSPSHRMSSLAYRDLPDRPPWPSSGRRAECKPNGTLHLGQRSLRHERRGRLLLTLSDSRSWGWRSSASTRLLSRLPRLRARRREKGTHKSLTWGKQYRTCAKTMRDEGAEREGAQEVFSNGTTI